MNWLRYNAVTKAAYYQRALQCTLRSVVLLTQVVLHRFEKRPLGLETITICWGYVAPWMQYMLTPLSIAICMFVA